MFRLKLVVDLQNQALPLAWLYQCPKFITTTTTSSKKEHSYSQPHTSHIRAGSPLAVLNSSPDTSLPDPPDTRRRPSLPDRQPRPLRNPILKNHPMHPQTPPHHRYWLPLHS
ncbi:hypothetical protein GLYMA_15G154450v4 [Glycine max]|nr:hypothetical protein GLYMA_15G154450v4 [Glycine max]KAH1147316.1 hypothetical protein GYH30_042468 [Glycine max]